MKQTEETQQTDYMDSALDVEAGAELCFGRYKLLKVLGQGGFGITYMGLHTGLGKTVAIKEYFPKDVFRRMEDGTQVSYSNKSISRKNIERFLREARTMAGLRHDNIVSVTDVFEENNTAYYVMDYVEGKSLESRGRMSEQDTIRYIRQVAGALKYIHSRNILHLDIKPANIMIDSSDRAVLIDFGISKHYDKEGNIESSTTTGYSAGYSPVEQMTPSGIAQFSPSTDIYALGATIYKITSGTTPPVSTLLADGEVLTKPADMSERLFKVVSHCMQVKRRDRPQSIDEFFVLLDSYSKSNGREQQHTKQEHTQTLHEETTRQQMRPASQRSKKKKRNVPAIVVFTILGIALAATLLWALFGGYGGTTETATVIAAEIEPGAALEVETATEETVPVEVEKTRQETRLQQDHSTKTDEQQAARNMDNEANFRKYKELGDIYWVSYTTSRFQDEDARLKVLQYYGEALKYKNDSEIRRKYNTLLDN